MTVDQFLLVYLDSEDVEGKSRLISPAEALARGLVEPGGKTGTQMALEEAAANRKRLESEQRAARRERRRQKRAARRSGV